jgi:ribosomal protein S18 acetylase RimI-like enzyme
VTAHEAQRGGWADTTVVTLALPRERLRPARQPEFKVAIRPVPLPIPAFSRFFYTAIGGDHHWVDRLGWTSAEWVAWLDRPELETWVSYHLGSPLAYVELELQEAGVVEIASFGVLPEVRGRRVGGHLLTHAVRRGFAMGADAIRVETCSLDSADAQRTYENRGFVVVEEREERRRLHEHPGRWPGAGAHRRSEEGEPER